MREFFHALFLTFVLMLSSRLVSAAPNEPPVESDTQVPAEKLSEISDPQLTVAGLAGPRATQFAKATVTWLAGDVGQEGEGNNQFAYGLSYSYQSQELRSQEWQIHWTTEKLAWLQWSERQFIDFDSLYDPYYKYGLSFFADPEDALSSLTRINNYFGTVAVGVLDLAQMGQWWTFEMGISLGLTGLAFHVQTGLQYSF